MYGYEIALLRFTREKKNYRLRTLKFVRRQNLKNTIKNGRAWLVNLRIEGHTPTFHTDHRRTYDKLSTMLAGRPYIYCIVVSCGGAPCFPSSFYGRPERQRHRHRRRVDRIRGVEARTCYNYFLFFFCSPSMLLVGITVPARGVFEILNPIFIAPPECVRRHTLNNCAHTGVMIVVYRLGSVAARRSPPLRSRPSSAGVSRESARIYADLLHIILLPNYRKEARWDENDCRSRATV